MPRLPGRESTRIKIPLEAVEVKSFIGVWEKSAFGRICSIEGCEHVISGRRATKDEMDAGTDLYIQCEGESTSSGAATIYDKRDPDDKPKRGLMICPCCLAKLDEAWREMNGNPE